MVAGLDAAWDGSFLPERSAGRQVHGIWVWKSSSVLKAPASIEALLGFCQSGGINEVYISTSEELSVESGRTRITDVIALFHQSNIRVDALLSSTNADMPGKPREKLLVHVHEIIRFNQRHLTTRFDGIHLDIEPQQRMENKGDGNLQFLPDLVNTFRAVRVLAESRGLMVDADIQVKLLKGQIDDRRMLLSALPRLTLMMYERSSLEDGPSRKTAKLIKAGREFLDLAYAGLDGPDLAKMSIALRTADYGDSLPTMLKALDEAFGANPHYLGWARHSYNDILRTVE